MRYKHFGRTGLLRSLEISLSDKTLRRLDEVRPGPGGEAPQAYAR